jgi:hypothetical protein
MPGRFGAVRIELFNGSDISKIQYAVNSTALRSGEGRSGCFTSSNILLTIFWNWKTKIDHGDHCFDIYKINES